jgi:alpha-glucosidase
MDREQNSQRSGNEWWRGGVIYQIYPRSFSDSSKDGIGDLNGITERLDYVAKLGADCIWLSPFFKSPMKDFGYDVSDYCDVDQMFGTLEDFDALTRRAKELGLKVMIDQVFSHTSDQHPWFKESRSSRDNPKADWFVWAESKPDGSPPNNWLSVFGGSAWQWDTRRCQYYLHNFLASQPDLNFHNEAVQAQILAVAKFWLDRGVQGFRLDTANFYFHDKLLRDNPPWGDRPRTDGTVPPNNPYARQKHLYDKTRPENLGFLKRLRALLDSYPETTSVGEIASDNPFVTISEYTSGGEGLHMAYLFNSQHRRGAGESHWHRVALLVLQQPRRNTRDDTVGRSQPAGSLGQSTDCPTVVDARQRLHLPGRGAGTDRGGRPLREASGPLWHHILAGFQGARRLPHTHALDTAREILRLLHR